MPSKNTETSTKSSTKKSVIKPPKSKKSTSASQTSEVKNQDEHYRMIATAAYYRAEKRGFKGNAADTVQDWLEAEMEIRNKQ